jgi:hypothetical protein
VKHSRTSLSSRSLPSSRVLMAALAAFTLGLGACATGPTGPEITPTGSTVQLGRIVGKTFLTQVNEETAPRGGGIGVGVGAIGGFGGGGGGGIGLGIDLGRLFGGGTPTRQIDIYSYTIKTVDGGNVTVNSPALTGFENGACVRVISANQPGYPRMSPSRECP